MLAELWHHLLYTPAYNALMYLYSGPAIQSMGLAVIELTVLLRLAMFPLTYLDERNRAVYERINVDIERIERDYRTDHVLRRERIRELLKEHKVSYWAKAVQLGIQLVVLILLYQVFMGGLRHTGAEELYSWVPMPGNIDTRFLGFDLTAPSIAWPVAVGTLLFLQIYSVQRRQEHLIQKSDIAYLLLFPMFSTVALLLLPMVKSLFVLTSMLFGIGVFWVRRVFWAGRDEEKKA